MKKMICVVTGSRADKGLLAWPLKCLREDGAFDVRELNLHGMVSVMQAQEAATQAFTHWQLSWVLLLGDRYEVLGAALAAHLLRIRIAHLCGGDVTEGSYDDAMRDCISRVATLHFATSEEALARLLGWGCEHVHLVGNPALDYIRYGDWRGERPMKEPYVLVSYQAETIDGTSEIRMVLESIGDHYAVILMPNPDVGSEAIRDEIESYCINHSKAWYVECLAHSTFLNYLAHCEEFIGNSSAIFYEAPELGVPTRVIGKRQRGRVIPWGDGHASERIVSVLKQFDRQEVHA